MRTISLPDDKLKEVLAALEHSSSSEHHRHCRIRRQNPCDCHVAKARAAYDIVREAARHVPVRARDLQADQWLAIENSLPMRIVSVQKAAGIHPRVFVRVDSGDAAGSHAETLTFGEDEQVSIFDLTV
jgi:hypothetical protein